MPGIDRNGLCLSCVLILALAVLPGCVSTGDGVAEGAGGERKPIVDASGRTPEEALELEVMLTHAAQVGDVDRVRALLEQGADPDGLSGTKARRYMAGTGRPGGWHGLIEMETALLAVIVGTENDWRLPEDERRSVWDSDPRAGIEVMRLLLEAGADPDQRGSMGRFALMEAAGGGSAAAVKLLLDHGAYVNASTLGYPTIDIHYADTSDALGASLNSGNAEVVSMLLEAEADVFERGYGMDALQRCAYLTDPAMMKLLLDHMDQNYAPDAPVLSRALGELVRQWPGGTGGARDDDPRRDRAEWSECFRLLLDRGAHLGYQDDDLVAYSAGEVDLQAFKGWLSNGGRQGLDAELTRWPRMQALVAGDLQHRLGEALAAGMDPSRLAYGFHREPYHPIFDVLEFADLEKEYPAALMKLLDAGLDMDVRGMWGETLLHFSAGRLDAWLAWQMIVKGADINARDKDGDTPLDRVEGDSEAATSVRRLLRQHGAKRGDEIEQAAQARAKLALEGVEAGGGRGLAGALGAGPNRDAVFRYLMSKSKPISRENDAVLDNLDGFEVGEVMRCGPDYGETVGYVVFDKQLDERGRSRFVYVARSGAVLPRSEGEAWRLGPEDVADLDADGVPELLIDVTLYDGTTRLSALRVVSLVDPSAADYVVLYPHRSEPGAFAWRLDDAQKTGKLRTVAFGPKGEGDVPMWTSWSLLYESEWLEENAAEPVSRLFGGETCRPWYLYRDIKTERIFTPADELALWLYPLRYPD